MTKTKQPRKQRLAVYTAPLHKRHKLMAAHLAEDLLLKYNVRSLPVRSGDTVKVLRGQMKGHVNRISKVDLDGLFVEVEGANITKADGKQLPMKLHPSNLLITKLDTTDRKRAEKLGKLGGRKK